MAKQPACSLRHGRRVIAMAGIAMLGLATGCSSATGAAGKSAATAPAMTVAGSPSGQAGTSPQPLGGSHRPAPAHPRTSQAAPRPSRHHAAGARLLLVHDPGEVTGTLAGPCHARDGGRLPDPGCTAGSADPAVTQADIGATICRDGYTATVRPAESQTERFKWDEAVPAYGYSSGFSGELDHLVPLELGGSNDAANLWPEAGGIPNPKDEVEDTLHRAVCDGQVSLSAAQRAIAADWETAETRLGISSHAAAPAPARTTAAPARTTAPAPPRTTAPAGTDEGTVHPGAFCSPEGATGHTDRGTPMRCTSVDGKEPRWRSAG